MRMKYVMFETEGPEGKRCIPVIFPELLVHAEVAKAMQRDHVIRTLRAMPRSAGFITINPLVHCHGKSESMKLQAHPDDARIISTLDYLHGIQA